VLTREHGRPRRWGENPEKSGFSTSFFGIGKARNLCGRRWETALLSPTLSSLGGGEGEERDGLALPSGALRTATPYL